jgi:hypothetical protein
METKMEIDYIPCIYATDFNQEILDYCDDRDIPTHCDSDVISIEDDGNPLAEMLKAKGYKFTGKFGDTFAIVGS